MTYIVVDIDETCVNDQVIPLLPSLKEFAKGTEADKSSTLVLGCDEHGLYLHNPSESAGVTRIDFLNAGLHYRLRTSGKRHGLAKAVGLDKLEAGRSLQVLDATAGLGRDALVLAHLGCEVVMLERHPVVHALLADGLARAERDASEEFQPVLERLQLRQADARQWLAECGNGQHSLPDIVYIDPMFPPREKAAKVKKDIALLHTLLGSETDLGSLLELAISAARFRVVLKRPDGKLSPGLPTPTLWIGEQPAAFAVYVKSSFSRMPR